jgi:hypothetical protein
VVDGQTDKVQTIASFPMGKYAKKIRKQSLATKRFDTALSSLYLKIKSTFGHFLG